MIVYRLVCSKHHHFEAWFQNSRGYDQQAEDGVLSCPHCGDRQIRKAIMAPSIARRGLQDAAVPAIVEAGHGAQQPASGRATAAEAATADASGAAVPEVDAASMMALMRSLRAHVESCFDNVGQRFAEEARRMHYGESEPRGIYGEADRDEARELVDEGIAICPLPVVPDLNS